MLLKMPHYIESWFRDTAGGPGCDAKCKYSGNRVLVFAAAFQGGIAYCSRSKGLTAQTYSLWP